ncbi:MAG: FMN-binding protein [Treponema sp.]|jgi:major membrane immunogen (membrane-anchored lipoprotein)|nr:FMN-binding protein [Treponema sp.]
MIFKFDFLRRFPAGILFSAVLCAVLAPGCAENSLAGSLVDGYYTAEMSAFDAKGWKEFISIYVSSGRIVSVEYNGKNASGLLKSWDPLYMQRMNGRVGTYPTEYTRAFSSSLLSRQNPDSIDAVSGATRSHAIFKLLAKTAIEQSRSGSRQVAFVAVPPELFGHDEE